MNDDYFDSLLNGISRVIMCLTVSICGFIMFLEIIKNEFCLRNIVLIIGFILLSFFCIYVSISILIKNIKDYRRNQK